MILAPNKRPISTLSALARDSKRFDMRAKTSKAPTFDSHGKEFQTIFTERNDSVRVSCNIFDLCKNVNNPVVLL